MEKVKVSREVARALNKLLENLTREQLFNYHCKKHTNGGYGSKLYSPLNDVSVDEIYEILKWGYEADSDPTDEEIKGVLVRLKSKHFNNKDILFKHPQWKDAENQILKQISHGRLSRLLKELDNQRPTPKTPRQMGAQIVRLTQPNARCQVKPTPEQSTAEALQAELDYELASLHHAINEGDEVEMARSKQRLTEIHDELYEPELEGFKC